MCIRYPLLVNDPSDIIRLKIISESDDTSNPLDTNESKSTIKPDRISEAKSGYFSNKPSESRNLTHP